VSASVSIEAELHRIWASLAETKRMRACLFTLIIWAGPREKYFQEVATRLLETFPCRLMFLSEDADNPDALKVSVEAASSGAGSDAVACDRINVRIGERARQRVPSLLLPHLVPDLPIYLVWGEDPALRGEFFESLRPWAQKLIFDSEMTSGLQRFAQKLIGLRAMAGQDIADLNWVRTDPWRALLSRTFQDPAHLQSLLGASTIKIRYNACTGVFCRFTTAQAIYLQAWLASELRWSGGSYDTIERHQRICCTTMVGDVVFLILPEERTGVPEGQISGVEITCRDGTMFNFSRQDAPGFVTDVHVETQDSCEMPTRMVRTVFERGHSLATEMLAPGTSPHFMEMLYWLARIPPSPLTNPL
jgi:glucose-6-phosphate dehydrogenase assembly protein OpcA